MNNDYSNRQNELRAVEQSLRSLVPGDIGVNRDRLMYESGWAACEAAREHVPTTPRPVAETPARQDSRRLLWPATSAALLLISATLSAMLLTRKPEPQIVYAYSSVQTSDQGGTEKQAPPYPPRTEHAAAGTASFSVWPDLLRSLGDGLTYNDRNYFALRSRVLAFGVDALPNAAVSRQADDSPGASPRYGEMRGALLGG